MRIDIKKPAAEEIARFMARQEKVSHSYPEIGATRDQFPMGYNHDRNRVLLGEGISVFDVACRALDQWQMFETGWVHTYPKPAPLRKGTTVAVVFRLLGLYWYNACRIVYVFRDPDRYGFAYGTLAGHVERGEERFFIERDQNGNVWYHIEAFSRPGHWLTWLGYPLSRWFQRRFVRNSFAAMQAAVEQMNTNVPKALI